jgi:hypothetical protein
LSGQFPNSADTRPLRKADELANRASAGALYRKLAANGMNP